MATHGKSAWPWFLSAGLGVVIGLILLLIAVLVGILLLILVVVLVVCLHFSFLQIELQL